MATTRIFDEGLWRYFLPTHENRAFAAHFTGDRLAGYLLRLRRETPLR